MEAVIKAAENAAELSRYLEKQNIPIDVREGDLDNTPLIEACYQKKDRNVIVNLILEGADLSAANLDGDTALIVAVRSGHLDGVSALLQNGAVSSVKNSIGRTALFEACTLGNYDIASVLLNRGAAPSSSDIFQNNCLMQACASGNMGLVSQLLNLGVNVTASNHEGTNALMIACQMGHADIAKLLVEYKAPMNAQNKDGDTALIVTAREGHRDLVSSLLKRGAKAAIANNDGETALLAACAKGHIDTVHTLISKCGQPTERDKNGNTALLIAANSGNTKLIKYLATSKAATEATNKEGNTAIHIAALAGDVGAITTLLRYGSNPSAKNKKHATPFILAAVGGNVQALRALMTGNSNLESRTSSGNTAFLEACRYGHVEVLELLVQNRVDIFAKNLDGFGALHLAASHDRDDVIKYLHSLGLDLSAVTKEGDTALILACRQGYLRSTARLIELGASSQLRDAEGNSPFLIACSLGHCDLIELLLKADPTSMHDVNDAGNNGLIEAAKNGKIGAAIFILKKGFDFNFKNAEGRNAFQYCAAIPGFFSEWWLECAQPIVITGATGRCASEVNGVYDPVSINASATSSIPLAHSDGSSLGDDTSTQFQYHKRLPVGFLSATGLAETIYQKRKTKLRLVRGGLVIERSKLNDKKPKIYAKLSYRGGLPENNKVKAWEVAQDSGYLWTKFDKQDTVRVWSKSQILELCTTDSDEGVVLQKLFVAEIQLGSLVDLLDLPSQLASWSNVDIIRYMQHGVDVYRIKAILLGPTGSGKTTLVNKLLSDNKAAQFQFEDLNAGIKTDGIQTSEWTYGDIIFSLWELIGQKVYLNTHSIFFNSYSLFILVWNPLDYDSDDTVELQGFIQSIRNSTPLAPIMIITTHADQHSLPFVDFVLDDLNEKYGNIYSYIHIGLPTNERLQLVKDEMVRVASSQPHLYQKIPGKLLVLQQELKRLGAVEKKFFISRAEYFEIACSTVDLDATTAEQALELFRVWGTIYVLSQGCIVLEPQRLSDVLACLITHSAATKKQLGDVASGILYHSESALKKVWGNYDPVLYPQFLDLLYENDLMYLLHDRNGDPLETYGVSIVPAMLPNGGSDKYEQLMRLNTFPDKIPLLNSIRIKCNLIPASFFPKLQCRCGFITLIGSSWKHGFAIELSPLSHTLPSSSGSSYALVCMQYRHQTITIYAYGAGTAARTTAMHAMVSLRDSLFPFMQFEEIDLIDGSMGRVGVENELIRSKDYGITAYEINLLVGKSSSDTTTTESAAGLDDNSIFLSGIGPRAESSRHSLMLDVGHHIPSNRDRNSAADTNVLKNKPGSPAVAENDAPLTGKEYTINRSHVVNLFGTDIYVSDHMKELIGLSEILQQTQMMSSFKDDCDQDVVNIDIQLTKCVPEIESYCMRSVKSESDYLAVLWVAVREASAEAERVVLYPIAPGPRIGHRWELLADFKMTCPSEKLIGTQSNVLIGLTKVLRIALLQLFDEKAARILDESTWIGLVDLSPLESELFECEARSFQKVSRPPYKYPIYVSHSTAERMKKLPHAAAQHLLDLVITNPSLGTRSSDNIDNEALYKLLYDFIVKQQSEKLDDDWGPQKKLEDITSFEIAEVANLTISENMFSRMQDGYSILKAAMKTMKHREYPTAFVITDSALVKSSLLSLTSSKSYARQAAVRRMREIFGVLWEPAVVMKERLASLLTSPVHISLLCECCLQPQPQPTQASHPALMRQSSTGTMLSRQPSGLTRSLSRQPSVISRQVSGSARRHGNDFNLTRQRSSFSRQFSGISADSSSLNRPVVPGDCLTVWPIHIKSPFAKLAPLLPLAFLSFKAAAAVNGPAHLGRFFGLSTPLVPEDTVSIMTDLVISLGGGSSAKGSFEMIEEKIRRVLEDDLESANLISADWSADYCVRNFGIFLSRVDPDGEWRNFLSRRVCENGEVVFVCHHCLASFNRLS